MNANKAKSGCYQYKDQFLGKDWRTMIKEWKKKTLIRGILVLNVQIWTEAAFLDNFPIPPIRYNVIVLLHMLPTIRALTFIDVNSVS